MLLFRPYTENIANQLTYILMKRFISNSLDIFLRITDENDTYYICGNKLFSKKDVIQDYYPLDNLDNILHVVTYEFVNY